MVKIEEKKIGERKRVPTASPHWWSRVDVGRWQEDKAQDDPGFGLAARRS